jgi:hypothetical protein
MRSAAAEPPPETTTLRVKEESFPARLRSWRLRNLSGQRGEGFSDVQYGRGLRRPSTSN